MATVMRRSGAKGQALIEFAVVVPLLMLLVLGIFEFGRIYHAKLVVTQAVREGARRAVVVTGTTQAAKETAAISEASVSTKDFAEQAGINRSDLLFESGYPTVTTPTAVVGGDGNKWVVVKAYYDVPLVFPMFGKAIGVGSSVHVTGMAIMRME